ncbi:MAG TPA: DUF882 domain-containing protein [Kofleriaceae bacterium]
MSMAAASWSAAASPVPLPAESVVTLVAAQTSGPVEVDLYDENDHQKGHIAIWRDGSVDSNTRTLVKHLFRCRRTHREAMIHHTTLSMLADVAERYEGKTIEYVSAFRVQRGESKTSPHRDARAIDFRIRGVQLREIRDYLWRTYTEVGVGWYPEGQFIHIDTRPTMTDMSWTFVHGRNRYHPYWSELARKPQIDEEQLAHARRSGS